MSYTSPYRQRVARSDGRMIQLVQKRAHILFCHYGCCCGRVDRGFPAVPAELYKQEWLRRRMRNVVHLTKAGCLGPCPLANVVCLLFGGRSFWFHSFAAEWQVRSLFDYVEQMLAADRVLPPPPDLAPFLFQYYDWEARPHPEPEPAETGPAESPLIAFFTHADTDLLALERARSLLPPGLEVHGFSLGAIREDRVMESLLAGPAGRAAAIVARLHGAPERIPGWDRLQEQARRGRCHLLLLSGPGDPDARLERDSTVPAALLHRLSAYLLAGGPGNVAEAFKLCSDELLGTAFGALPPVATPDTGIYLPDVENPTLEDWLQRTTPGRPAAAVLFYRAHLLSGNTFFIDALSEALELEGFTPLCIYTSSLTGPRETLPPALELLAGRAEIIISTLAFAHNRGAVHRPDLPSVFEELGAPVLQAIPASMPESIWSLSKTGLSPLETAIHVALPELDGRITTVPISFKERSPEIPAPIYQPVEDRCSQVASLAAAMVRLRTLPADQKRIAIILNCSSARTVKAGEAVGLDTPASLAVILAALRSRGYQVEPWPEDPVELMHFVLARGSYDATHPLDELTPFRLAGAAYQNWYCKLPENVRQRIEKQWGPPLEEPNCPYRCGGSYLFSAVQLGNVLVALQPPRGYNLDPDAIYHTPDLPPTHHYLAFYRWLEAPPEQGGFGACAAIQLGKHGTLEWLPGKGVGLSSRCFPELALGSLPLFYPFIINDPGEGCQAKRRAHAVIVDHMTPPMTRAETYGPLAELNQLVNEYYALEAIDPAKLPAIQKRIWELIRQTELDQDLDLRARLRQDHGDHKHEWDEQLTEDGVPATLAGMSGMEVSHLIQDLDGYLCELGLAQIRDGLHILGQMPPLPEMLLSLTRLPNGPVPSLPGSLLRMHGYDYAELGRQPGTRLPAQVSLFGRRCFSHADLLEAAEQKSVELLEALEREGFSPSAIPRILEQLPCGGSDSLQQAMRRVCDQIAPSLEKCTDEVEHLLLGLDGGFVPPGPSGAPTRGAAWLLPTGRNFYAVDPRNLPSPVAWEVGKQLAAQVADRYRNEEGQWPETVAITLWGTSQMRTQGDDAAQVLALLGIRPVWHPVSRSIERLEPVPLDELGRPRIDVVMRISGFFRDAFPHLVALLDEAVELAMSLEEPPEANFPRKHRLEFLDQCRDLPAEEAERQARARIFGSKPGSYGCGLLSAIETGNWSDAADLAEIYIQWGGYAYGRDMEGVEARELLEQRLGTVQVALHNQDNREHDIFDSDDYFQFHGGLVASIRSLTGKKPKAWFGDTSRPEAVRVRDLREEVLRVYRTRVVNPKWLAAMQRHGFKGAQELAATVDYIFGFDATAEIIPDFVWTGLAQRYALDEGMQAFLLHSNPWALESIVRRLQEAAERGLWQTPDPSLLEALQDAARQAETAVEAASETGGRA
ncbi:MAG: cobaltochelatase subunit CobN [Bryobacterales bacterium]|nr:cobaltochelatase subunit CobN [Bryobacteraceae bacterium]MDW8356091.1 cobaltochelatase subunit CobN [Bryobacterales bacterium]